MFIHLDSNLEDKKILRRVTASTAWVQSDQLHVYYSALLQTEYTAIILGWAIPWEHCWLK